MDADIRVLLVLLLSLTATTADLSRLMDRLNTNTWPWFGERYSPRCRNPDAGWPRCYNPRPDNKFSVLNSIGVHSFTPTYELEVIFSAPSEMVDVCGKSVSLPEVKPFKLNDNGFAISDLLKQGAEIYRRMPIIKWNGTLTGEHSLLFMDAGFVKVRGYMANIRTNGTHLLGEVLWPYTPPANPNPFRNPIVILLMTQTLEDARSWLPILLSQSCITRGLSKEKFQDCIRSVLDKIGAAKVKAVQVLYTDGSSKYEKYRCCVEGSFCDAECISDFKSHAQAKASSIQFTTVSAASLDMYVNLEASSTQPFNYTACCHFFVVEGVPGDNNLLDDTAKLNQTPRVEFSGSGETAVDTNTFYSVLMVDPDAVLPNTPKLPYGHFWTANLKYQDLTDEPPVTTPGGRKDCALGTEDYSAGPGRISPREWRHHYKIGTRIMSYELPTPPDNVEHTYYILLYSHTRFVEVPPTGFFQAGACDRCGWDFSKLPADHKLRGISWFKAKKDNFTLEKSGGCALAQGVPPQVQPPQIQPPQVQPPEGVHPQEQPPQSVPPHEVPPQGQFPFSPPRPCVPNVVPYQKIPQLAIKLAYAGNLTESADPINPDFDYDDGTQSRGNVLGNCETLWLIVFCVRVLEEIHV